jgi:CheY-like chemotaxis protein
MDQMTQELAQAGEALRVLLVDDEPINLEVGLELLSYPGVEVDGGGWPGSLRQGRQPEFRHRADGHADA